MSIYKDEKNFFNDNRTMCKRYESYMDITIQTLIKEYLLYRLGKNLGKTIGDKYLCENKI